MKQVFLSLLLIYSYSLWGQFQPEINKPFPNLSLIDQYGNFVELKKYKGKVILLEPVGMTCAACQALSGAHKKGPLGSVIPQVGLKTIDEYVQQFGKGVQISNPNLLVIQIIFYNNFMAAPQPKEIQKWIQHFNLSSKSNFVVLGAPKKLVTKFTRGLIPGFYLIDKSFTLRWLSVTPAK